MKPQYVREGRESRDRRDRVERRERREPRERSFRTAAAGANGESARPELSQADANGSAARVGTGARGALRRALVVIGMFTVVSLVIVAAFMRRPALGISKIEQLQTAISRGDDEAALKLVAEGVSVDARDTAGFTPLMEAAWMGREKLVRQLVARGADVNARTPMGWTALMFAARGGHEELLRILISEGAETDRVSREGASALYVAALWGYEGVVGELLAAGADPDGGAACAEGESCAESDAKPNVPLIAAAAGGHLNVVRQLLHSGASVDLAEADGRTALGAARAGRHRSVSGVLMAAGAQGGDATGGYARAMSHKPCRHGSVGSVRHTQRTHHASWLRRVRAVRSGGAIAA